MAIKPDGGSSISETAHLGRLALLLLLSVTPARAEEVGGDHRLLGRFIEDGAIVQKAWIEAAAQYEERDAGRDLWGTATLALRFGRDVEAGFMAGIVDRRREAGAVQFGAAVPDAFETTGLSDPTVYGKYRVLRSPIELAIGAAVVLPITDASRGLSPGNERARGFVGLRRTLEHVTLVGSLGLSDRSDSRAAGRAPGRVAGLLGTGILIPISYDWAIMGEVNIDGARFEGDGTDSRLLAGVDWRPTANTVLRGAVGRGLSDSAPRLSTVLSGVFHF